MIRFAQPKHILLETRTESTLRLTSRLSRLRAEGRCLTCTARLECDVVVEAPEMSAVPGRRVVPAGARVLSADQVSRGVTVVRLHAA